VIAERKHHGDSGDCWASFWLEAGRVGFRVRYRLVSELVEAASDKHLSKTIKSLRRVDLLRVDVLGYRALDNRGAALLFQVLTDREERTRELTAKGTGVTPKSGMDLAAYFARIGYSGPADPTLVTLSEVVAAHIRSIPYENLDPLLGVPVADLGPAALADKLIRRRRGGYCYEHNNLMRYVLEYMGFAVDALASRVVWMSSEGLDGPSAPQTHQMLAVRIPGVDDAFLVDVGLGAQTLSSPIRLSAGPIQQTRHEPCRLRTHRQGYVLEALVREAWQPLYTFTIEPRPMIDMEIGSWYVSTHPKSTFVARLTAALVTDDARWDLRGRNLAIHTRGGHTEHIRFDTAAQVLDALTSRFGINLCGLGDLEARATAVLDN
jgi:arylamine N-acetyltransferase